MNDYDCPNCGESLKLTERFQEECLCGACGHLIGLEWELDTPDSFLCFMTDKGLATLSQEPQP